MVSVRVEDLQHLSGGFDLSVPRFTQDNVNGKGRKSRSQVLGEPVTVNGKQIRGMRSFDTIENRGFILVQAQ